MSGPANSLDQLGEQVRTRGFDGVNPVEAIRFATASGHGIGKSTITSWLILWIMATRPFCKGTVTAAGQDSIRTKTWASLATWHRLFVGAERFKLTSGRGSLSLVHKDYPEDWRVDGRSCKKEDAQSFGGQHAANSTSFFIFDEASEVPDEVYRMAEYGMTDGEPMFFLFGNPIMNTGMFYESCVGRLKHDWIVRQIDSRTVKITNKKLYEKWLADLCRGDEDADLFKVRVRGQFPSQGSIQFIPTHLVEQAMRLKPPEENKEALVLGVDVARFGDDASVVYPRRGRDGVSMGMVNPKVPYEQYRGLDTIQTAGRVIEHVRFYERMGYTVEAIFVDGNGVGGGVVDQLNALGYPVREVQPGGAPLDSGRFKYKSDECWGLLRDALERGEVALPDDEALKAELTQRQFGYTPKGQISLESKSDMKARLGGDSPDRADGLSFTYAYPVRASAKDLRDDEAHRPEWLQPRTPVVNSDNDYLKNIMGIA